MRIGSFLCDCHCTLPPHTANQNSRHWQVPDKCYPITAAWRLTLADFGAIAISSGTADGVDWLDWLAFFVCRFYPLNVCLHVWLSCCVLLKWLILSCWTVTCVCVCVWTVRSGTQFICCPLKPNNQINHGFFANRVRFGDRATTSSRSGLAGTSFGACVSPSLRTA